MNNYPEWWDTTVTVYNKFEKPDGEIIWFRHVIHDTFYKLVREKITVGDTTMTTNESVCRIRISDDFMEPIPWLDASEAEKAQFFTLRAGDIIVGEETDFVIDEYTSGSRSSDLKNRYQNWPGCFVVERASINVGAGRGNEHYLARGM